MDYLFAQLQPDDAIAARRPSGWARHDNRCRVEIPRSVPRKKAQFVFFFVFFLHSRCGVDRFQLPKNHSLALIVLFDMRSVVCQTRVRRSVAALAVLLILGWFAPSRALATCGDYLTMRHHGGTEQSQLPLFANGASTQALPTDSELLQLLPHAPIRGETTRPVPCQQCPASPGEAPCQGPWCSGSHAPMPVPTAPVETSQDSWACWWSAQQAAQGQQLHRTMLDADLNRVHHVFPIFHPPRPV
jgi:hypothetical protein